MLERVLDLVARLLGPFGRLASRLVPPLRVEVTHIRYEEWDTRACDRFVIISPWPRRYLAKMIVTNRSSRPVYVRAIRLSVNDEVCYAEAEAAKTLRIEPGEPKEYTAVFPVSEEQTPAEAGKFWIEVVPGVGRKTRVTGRFPLPGALIPPTTDRSRTRRHGGRLRGIEGL